MKNKRQRGSIEVVILIIVVAVIAGIIFWRYTEAEKAQQDADQAATYNTPSTQPEAKSTVQVQEMSLEFQVPKSAGDVTYAMNESGAAQLMSGKLAKDGSDCVQDNDGKFALLRTANEGDRDVVEALKAKVGDTEYVLQLDYKECYSEDDRKQLDALAEEIAGSLRKLDVDGSAE